MTPELLSHIRARDASNIEDMDDALICDGDRSALLQYVGELEALIQEAAGCTEREWYSTVQRKIRAANAATLARSQSDAGVKP